MPTIPARAGSVLLTSLLTVLVLSLVAGNVLAYIAARYNSGYRSAAWNQALLTADTGIAITLSELAREIPDVQTGSVSGLGTGFSQNPVPSTDLLQVLPSGSLPDGTLLTINPAPFSHGGEGGTTQRTTITLKAVNLSALLAGNVGGTLGNLSGALNGGDIQLLQLDSTGTVPLTGPRVASPNRQDNDLWRPSLYTDRSSGLAISTASVSRQVEVLLRPVRPYEAAVVGNDALLAADPGTTFDSFNSTSPLASTGGQYDSTKRRAHGTVRVNSGTITLGGLVYGDANTNGGILLKDNHVTGTVNNGSYAPLPLVKPPTWTSNNPLAPAAVSGNTTLPAQVLLVPAQYRFTGLSGTLHITGTAGMSASIYIDGDWTGGLVVDPGVSVKVYVSGGISTNASRIVNGSRVAAALQIFGVYKDATSMPSVRLGLDTGLAATIYAPGHRVYLSGSGDLSGAIVGARFETSGPVRVHYDEALAYNVGPLLRYEIASWREVTK